VAYRWQVSSPDAAGTTPVATADRPQRTPAQQRTRAGIAAGAGAYLLWGVFPLYFPLLAPAGALEILVHRVLWSLVVCVVVLTVARRWRRVREVVASRAMLVLPPAAVLIAVNWLVYVYAVNSAQVVQTALGYYINPLVTVLLGVVLLRERLRRLQWGALGIGMVAVVVMTLDYGRLPWIALVLACSFGTYGLLKNRVGRGVDALTSLSVETAVLAPVALGVLVWLETSAQGTLTSQGPGHALLLASTGIITAVPLLMFASAARRIPLSMIGLLQYVTPSMQLLIGVAVQGEPMTPGRWAGFGLVWLALAVLTVDLLTAAQRRRTEDVG
jgi:chloramphenicol-sensitive protein RarD